MTTNVYPTHKEATLADSHFIESMLHLDYITPIYISDWYIRLKQTETPPQFESATIWPNIRDRS